MSQEDCVVVFGRRWMFLSHLNARTDQSLFSSSRRLGFAGLGDTERLDLPEDEPQSFFVVFSLFLPLDAGGSGDDCRGRRDGRARPNSSSRSPEGDREHEGRERDEEFE
eukprot:scaffold186207_cov28-Tisochrysis_lutea.AAC.4